MTTQLNWRDLTIRPGAKLSDNLIHFLDRSSKSEIHTFFAKPEKSPHFENSLLSRFFLSRLKNRLVVFESLPKDGIIQAVDPNFPKSKRMLAKFRDTAAEILARARSIDTGEIVSYRIGHAAYHLKETNKIAFIKRRWWDLYAVGKDKKRQYKKVLDILATATKDPLTGLLNRFELEKSYDKIQQSTLRRNHDLPEEENRKGFSLIVIDLDHFKKVNDEHGHPAGDAVLKSVADIISSGLRSDDTVFRYGGEEFIIVSSDVKSAKNAEEFAEKIRQRMEKSKIDIGKGKELTVTASIGVHFVQPSHRPEHFKEAFEEADRAVYAAKHGGRNRVVSTANRETATVKADHTPKPEIS